MSNLIYFHCDLCVCVSVCFMFVCLLLCLCVCLCNSFIKDYRNSHESIKVHKTSDMLVITYMGGNPGLREYFFIVYIKLMEEAKSRY